MENVGTAGIHHVSICVTDFGRSKAFYDRVLAYLGMSPVFETTGYPHKAADRRLCMYRGNGAMLGLWEVDEHAERRPFRLYDFGLHHIAFGAPSREAVDELHRKLSTDGTTILERPAEYPYEPGYYALYFADPDGVKLEFVFTPLP